MSKESIHNYKNKWFSGVNFTLWDFTLWFNIMSGSDFQEKSSLWFQLYRDTFLTILQNNLNILSTYKKWSPDQASRSRSVGSGWFLWKCFHKRSWKWNKFWSMRIFEELSAIKKIVCFHIPNLYTSLLNRNIYPVSISYATAQPGKGLKPLP